MEDYDYQQMLSGQLYMASGISFDHQSIHGKKLAQQINQLPIDKTKQIISLERQLVAHASKNIYINPPLYVDYGRHITIGDNFYANQNCTFLDVNSITIGNDVLIGPNVGLYTAGHPLDATIRRSGLEYGQPIVIGDDVWIGGSAVILPGVTIGARTIVGAGAVVTKDLPDDSIAVGNPAHILRKLTPVDYNYWSKLRREYLSHYEN